VSKDGQLHRCRAGPWFETTAFAPLWRSPHHEVGVGTDAAE